MGNGLHFERQAPARTSAPQRADVACFAGFVRRRSDDLPAHLERWLIERGWLSPPGGPTAPYARPGARKLLDVPVPIDSWDVFDEVFAWEERDLDGRGLLGATWLGAAVRSFFAEGGRKCYVVRVGDPGPFLDDRDARRERLAQLLPGYPLALTATPADRGSWRGVGHLYGLAEVSFLALPDLAELVASPAPPPVLEPPAPAPAREIFVECSKPQPPPAPDGYARSIPAPRCDEQGYGEWAQAVRRAAELLARRRREVQLLAAVPIPLESTPAAAGLIGFLAGEGWLDGGLDTHPESLASAFVQLAYPWLSTPGSRRLPQGLESPDGVLAGMLARNALARGTFRSAARQAAAGVVGLFPELGRGQLFTPPPRAPEAGSLSDRVSVFGFAPRGAVHLLSDATTSVGESYRPAAVNRLVSVLVRAARRLGEDATFEAAGEGLWARVRERMSSLLGALYRAGALRGARAEEAFSVRCDRSTMSQNDVDQGRVVAEIVFQPAHPIRAITVVLVLDEGGQASLAVTREEAA
ncbi:MAG: phage tail sheath protein [bacterium]|nr:phage tail sheath protein [bacterium]